MKAKRRCIEILVAAWLGSLLANGNDGARAQDERPDERGPTTAPGGRAKGPAAAATEAARGDEGDAPGAASKGPEAAAGQAGAGESEPTRPTAPPPGQGPEAEVGVAGETPAPRPAADLTPLRTELAEVMDELVQARGRVATLSKTLFETRVRVTIQNLAGDEQRLRRISLELDGAPIFTGGVEALKTDEEEQVFEGFAAPGPHTLVLEAEQRGRDDGDYRYGLHERFHFRLPRDRSTELRVILDDDSDMAEDFDDDEEGEYDIRTRLKVRAHPIGEG